MFSFIYKEIRVDWRPDLFKMFFAKYLSCFVCFSSVQITDIERMVEKMEEKMEEDGLDVSGEVEQGKQSSGGIYIWSHTPGYFVVPLFREKLLIFRHLPFGVCGE
jgi:hypothetical protein